MTIKKTIISVVVLAFTAGFLGGGSSHAQTLTIDELQRMVAVLQAQLDVLLKQIQEMKGDVEVSAFCYDFQDVLRIGGRGDDVTALQTALQKDGVYTGPITGYFGQLTRGGVIRFQEKYNEEILAPFGIVQGTGYVGTATRGQLNKLFKCKQELIISFEGPPEVSVEPKEESVEEPESGGGPPAPGGEDVVEEADLSPTLALVSPNGGETWDIGKEYEIKWDSANVSQVEIRLYRSSQLVQSIASVDADSESYKWTIPSGFTVASDYAIHVADKSNTALFDESDTFFRMAVDGAAPVLSKGSPSGIIAAGTKEALISLSTNERATCRYATKLAKDYYSMINTFATTDSTSHETLVTGLQNGYAYSYYVKCLDVAGNRNFQDFPLSFQVGN